MTPAIQLPATARHQEVTRLLQAGDLKTAEVLCNRLTTDFPQFYPGWHSASFIALCRGQVATASEMIQRALAHSPSDPRYLLQHARCLGAQRRVAESIASAAAAERAAANDAHLLDAIGSFYNSVGEHQKATEAYSRAIGLDPSQALFWFNRATVRRFLGQIAEAEEDYDRALTLRPNDYEAYSNRSELRKQTPERNHIEAMERVLAPGVAHWRGEVQLRYALAKEYEDLEQYPQSWRHLERGARLRREHLRYDVRHDVDTVDWIIRAFPNAPAEAGDACPSREPGAARPGTGQPIFIVGLPRSGTTLVERILGTHSNVFAAGELNHFAAALVSAALTKTGGRPLPRAQLVAATRELDFTALGADYVERTRPATSRLGHFTDKMPLNYLYCGLIRRALPDARIVHVTRHPLASCYAMFKTLFKDGYPFSYDLDDIARYYVGYRRLMDHWRRSMPGAIYDISYERLVRDPEGESRRLLAACGLEWQRECLEFYRNPTATTTASAAQVRRPIYDSSLNQWRQYETQLGGLRAQLLAAGIDLTELSAH
ncbi:MAG: tetratricopeptide repeat-containing sulfotransferase family protein [Steroidobacteraceae bacterium]